MGTLKHVRDVEVSGDSGPPRMKSLWVCLLCDRAFQVELGSRATCLCHLNPEPVEDVGDEALRLRLVVKALADTMTEQQIAEAKSNLARERLGTLWHR